MPDSKRKAVVIITLVCIAAIAGWYFVHKHFGSGRYVNYSDCLNLDNPSDETLVLYVGKDTVEIPPNGFLKGFPLREDSVFHFTVRTKSGKVLCDSVLPKADYHDFLLNPTRATYVEWVQRYTNGDGKDEPDDSLFDHLTLMDDSVPVVGNIRLYSGLLIRPDDYYIYGIVAKRKLKTTVTLSAGTSHSDEAILLRKNDFLTLYNTQQPTNPIEDAQVRCHNAIVQYYNQAIRVLDNDDRLLTPLHDLTDEHTLPTDANFARVKMMIYSDSRYSGIAGCSKMFAAQEAFVKVMKDADSNTSETPTVAPGIFSPLTVLTYYRSGDTPFSLMYKSVYDPHNGKFAVSDYADPVKPRVDTMSEAQ